jgi:alpha-galactosidase/6-phospho-beta-glucosidase family protein
MCVNCVLASPRITQVDPGDGPPSKMVLPQKERIVRSLVQKAALESNYMEQVCSMMLQKHTAAERKQLRLLEAERMKAQARLLRIQRGAMIVCKVL